VRPEQVEETQEMIDDCNARYEKLSEWEENFVDSVEKQLEERGYLSDKQLQILEKLWERVTKNG